MEGAGAGVAVRGQMVPPQKRGRECRYERGKASEGGSGRVWKLSYHFCFSVKHKRTVLHCRSGGDL